MQRKYAKKVQMIASLFVVPGDDPELTLKAIKAIVERVAEEITKAFHVDRKEFRQILENKGITLIDIKHKILNCRFQ